MVKKPTITETISFFNFFFFPTQQRERMVVDPVNQYQKL